MNTSNNCFFCSSSDLCKNLVVTGYRKTSLSTVLNKPTQNEQIDRYDVPHKMSRLDFWFLESVSTENTQRLNFP